MERTETDRLAYALAEIPGVRCVTRGWPKERDTLPCIVLELAGERGADFRDNREYLTEREYYVRVFAPTAALMDAVALEVKTRMSTLGYERVFQWEDFSAEVRQTVLRYRGYGMT